MVRFAQNREVLHALDRIKKVLQKKRGQLKDEVKVETKGRDIRLGLKRIQRVVTEKQTWKGVHVGGTNGKGSICAFLSGLFKLAGIGHGLFTSPAFPERHNGVLINGRFVNKRMHDIELERIRTRFNKDADRWRFNPEADGNLGPLSPFELETATAFRVFDKMNVEYGIVEVGMGGLTDATNAMQQKSVTVISKIDLDHQEYLGNTIEKIAAIKAGIMRRSVPCIVDDSNPKEVIDVLREHAKRVGTQVFLSHKADPILKAFDMDGFALEHYQKQNLRCAALAFRHLFPLLPIDIPKLLSTQPYLPGRMEHINVSKLTAGHRERSVLVDGAHNRLGVEALAKYVDTKLRKEEKPVTWVMGLSASKSKPLNELVDELIRPQDNFAFVEFLPGPNDPPPAPSQLGRDHARSIIRSDEQIYEGEPTIGQAIQWASEKASGGPIVITGSLYLIRDLYKISGITSSRMPGERRPGRSQLWHYIKEAQTRELTPEEEQEFKRARRHWRLDPIRHPVFRKYSTKLYQPKIRPGVPEAQRMAAWHQKQADKYSSALETAESLVAQEASDTPSDNEALSTLRQEADGLKDLVKQHKTAVYHAMRRVRGHAVMPGKKWMSYNEVFGHPPRRSMKQAGSSLFLNYQEPTLPKDQGSE